MSSNAARAELLVRALRAAIEGDRATLEELSTPDVRVWAPAVSGSSRDEMLAALERRDGAFSEVELVATPLDVGGDYACAEWDVTMTHSGPLTLRDGAVVEPTGTTVTVHGVTVAEFDGDRICAVRQYWDALTVFDQLGLVADAD